MLIILNAVATLLLLDAEESRGTVEDGEESLDACVEKGWGGCSGTSLFKKDNTRAKFYRICFNLLFRYK